MEALKDKGKDYGEYFFPYWSMGDGAEIPDFPVSSLEKRIISITKGMKFVHTASCY